MTLGNAAAARVRLILWCETGTVAPGFDVLNLFPICDNYVTPPTIMSRLGRRGLTNATKASYDFRCPERARISWGKPCGVGVRGRDLILSRSGQGHMMRR